MWWKKKPTTTADDTDGDPDYWASQTDYYQKQESIEGYGPIKGPVPVDEREFLRHIARQNKRMLDTLGDLRRDVQELTGAVGFGFFIVIVILGVIGVMIYLRFFAHLPVS